MRQLLAEHAQQTREHGEQAKEAATSLAAERAAHAELADRFRALQHDHAVLGAHARELEFTAASNASATERAANAAKNTSSHAFSAPSAGGARLAGADSEIVPAPALTGPVLMPPPSVITGGNTVAVVAPMTPVTPVTPSPLRSTVFAGTDFNFFTGAVGHGDRSAEAASARRNPATRMFWMDNNPAASPAAPVTADPLPNAAAASTANSHGGKSLQAQQQPPQQPAPLVGATDDLEIRRQVLLEERDKVATDGGATKRRLANSFIHSRALWQILLQLQSEGELARNDRAGQDIRIGKMAKLRLIDEMLAQVAQTMDARRRRP
jgi:hypothetical protein